MGIIVSWTCWEILVFPFRAAIYQSVERRMLSYLDHSEVLKVNTRDLEHHVLKVDARELESHVLAPKKPMLTWSTS